MAIQKERWLVSYHFETVYDDREITHMVLNDQNAKEAREGEELEEIIAIAREDALVKLGLDEDIDGELLGQMVLTSVVPLGEIKDISIVYDEDAENAELEEHLNAIDDMVDNWDDVRPHLPGTVQVHIPAPLPAYDSWTSGFKEAVGALGEVAGRELGGVMRLTGPVKKEPLQ